jgi:hypothetical protein
MYENNGAIATELGLDNLESTRLAVHAGCVCLGDNEKCDGLMYTAITRVIRTANLGFSVSVTMDKIGKSISEKYR